MISLRSPDFGNTITLNTRAILGRSQDGDLIQFYDPSWTMEDSFAVTFSGLSKEQKDAFIDWFTATRGQPIVFRDHENRQWDGFIYTPLRITQPLPGCGFQLNFGFTGRAL